MGSRASRTSKLNLKVHMLKYILTIAILLLPLNAKAQILDFKILSTNNSHIYRSTTFQSELETQYDFSIDGTVLILLETPSFENEEYLKQNSILESFGHETESLQLIYIISCTTKEYEHGYHTTLEVAKSLNSGNKFRIRLLSINGLVLHESLAPISKEEIKTILSKTRKNS